MGAVRDLVASHAGDVRALLSAHKAKDIRLFGSGARGDDGPQSDIDFLVEFAPGASILDQVHLEEALTRLLGRDVDVVPLGALKARDRHLIEESLPL